MNSKFAVSFVLALPFLFAGCSSKKSEPAPAPQSSAETTPAPAPEAKPKASLLDTAQKLTASAQDEAKAVNDAAAEKPAETTASGAGESSSSTNASSLVSSLSGGDVNVADLTKKAAAIAQEYAGKLGSLENGLALAKSAMDKAGISVPASVKQKYDEAKSLVPEIKGLVDELKSYQGTNLSDLSNLTTKLQGDYSRAEKLYQEIMALIPKSN